MPYSRRTLLGTSVLASIAMLAAGCATSTTPATPSSVLTQLSTDVGLVATALSSELAAGVVTGVTPAVAAQIQGYLATVTADMKTIQAAVAAATAPSVTVVQQFSTAVDTVVGLVLPYLPSTSNVAEVLQAAEALLPVILAAVGLVGAKLNSKFSPADARGILAAVAK
jgi:hypothetical protein